MKVAFLFAGQLRDIPIDLFKKSLINLTDSLEYDIYAYLWDEAGKSLNHSEKNIVDKVDINPKVIVNDLFKGFNIKAIKYDSFTRFKDNLEPKYLKIYKNNKYHSGTINALPQIFTLQKCFELINTEIDSYDLIFKCRFDSLFVHPLRLYNLEKIKISQKVYSLNFGRAFYPKRIYDIFFGGSQSSMMFLSKIWDNLPYLVADEFDNKLDKRDACRILYLAVCKHGKSVDSFETRICDVFRNFKYNYYERYILSMHLISLKNFLKNIFIIYYFYNWFNLRKFSLFKFVSYLLIAVLISPLSYLKRIKYIK